MNNSQLAVPPSLQESSSTTPVTSKSTVSISSSPSAPDLIDKQNRQTSDVVSKLQNSTSFDESISD